MIFHEGAERYLALSVWARGGQAPLRARTSLLTGTFAGQADCGAVRARRSASWQLPVSPVRLVAPLALTLSGSSHLLAPSVLGPPGATPAGLAMSGDRGYAPK
jgi:hypothetical protein